MLPKNLTPDALEDYERRVRKGERALAAENNGRPVPVPQADGDAADEDRLMFAADAISNILTAALGPAGYDGDLNLDRLEQASSLLDRALTGYEGDAEDYTTEED